MLNKKKIGFFLLIGIFYLCECNITSFDSIYNDYIEFESVWQYLNAYSIYYERLKGDAFSYNSIEEMMISLGDTLYGKRYTRYIENEFDDIELTAGNSLTYSNENNITVFLDTLTDSTVIIKINSFLTGITHNEFTDAIRYTGSFPNLIIDLRGNGGGDIEETVSIIDEFLPIGTSFIMAKERVYDKEKREAKTEDWHPWQTEEIMNPILSSKRIVILMDGNTASASEIMIAALKDCRDATLVGSKTYGKGIGQIKIQRRHRLGIQTTFVQFKGIGEKTGLYHERGIKPDVESLDSALQKHKYENGNDRVIITALKLLEPNVRQIIKTEGREYKKTPVGAYKIIYVE